MWLYGEGRKSAENMVPSLAPMLKQIESPHKQLHESAVRIGKVFKQVDRNLPAFLAEKEVDHLKWASEVRDALIENAASLNVQTDFTKCALGNCLANDG